MLAATGPETSQTIKIDSADIQIQATMIATELVIDVLKQGSRVHRLTVDGAAWRLEHPWLVEMFAKEHRVELNRMAGEMHDYMDGLDVRQG